MSPIDVIQVMLAGTILFLVAGVGVVGLRWIWQRIDRGAAAPVEAIEELRARMAELERGSSHLAELEERLDFAERMLAEQRAPERLGRG